MKKKLLEYFLVLTFSFSVSAQASFKDKVLSFWEDIQSYLGIKQEKRDDTHFYELPSIPQPKDTPTDVTIYQRKLDKLYPANEKIKGWSIEKVKKINIAFIREVYDKVQLREPMTSEIEKWFNTLSQGSAREGIYRAIVLGDGYRLLINSQQKSKDEVIRFTKFYIKKYLQQKARSDLLEKADFFRLKKIIIDNTLKTLELLSSQPKDFFHWYAVFSADLAREYPKVWRYQFRAEPDEHFHYRWATETPYQIVLSEVYLKLHGVFNSLQGLSPLQTELTGGQ